MLKKIFLSLLLVLPLTFVSIDASACPGHKHGYYGPKNSALVNKVIRNLRANPSTYDQHICVTARGHKVMLSGTVGTPMQRATAVTITRYTRGVGLVIDNLYLQSP